MCLIALAHHAVPDIRLAVLANRDEFHARPTAPADFWPDHPHVLAGRDLEAGGTWMGVTRSGRFAALTNYAAIRADAPKSRGTLVADFLTTGTGTLEFLRGIRGEDYAGFNLVLFDGETLLCATNDGSAPRALGTGAHAISNTSIDADWPKMRDTRALLARAVETGINRKYEQLFLEMRDTQEAADRDLPTGDAPLELRRRTSSRFVLGEDYGTRSTTLILIGAVQIDFEERSFGPMGQAGTRQRFTLTL
ncbi:MAG: NRDE family protein [Gammaproteobacteria bacterium]|nr:NRDE family protein [Gammaproteobacteria bacterium]